MSIYHFLRSKTVLVSPRAAQQGINVLNRKNINDSPPWGTCIRTHYWWWKKKKAQHPAGIEPPTSRVFAPQACALPLFYNHCPLSFCLWIRCLNNMYCTSLVIYDHNLPIIWSDFWWLHSESCWRNPSFHSVGITKFRVQILEKHFWS